MLIYSTFICYIIVISCPIIFKYSRIPASSDIVPHYNKIGRLWQMNLLQMYGFAVAQLLISSDGHGPMSATNLLPTFPLLF